MVLFIGASIYLPTFFVSSPQYDFIYTTGYANYSDHYDVVNGKISKIPPQYPANTPPSYGEKVRLYLHSTESNTNREILFEEAQTFRIITDRISPDGFEVIQSSGSSGFFPFFYSSSRPGYYLNGHNVSRKISIGSSYSYYDFQFLGWVQR